MTKMTHLEFKFTLAFGFKRSLEFRLSLAFGVLFLDNPNITE